jgi:hypothetical protein
LRRVAPEAYRPAALTDVAYLASLLDLDDKTARARPRNELKTCYNQ